MKWNPFSKKAYPAPASNSFFVGGMDYEVKRTLDAFYREGYAQNPIVYACISVIAKNAASVKLEMRKGEKVLTSHPLLDFLRKPNPTQSWVGFIKELITFHQIAGEVFILRLPNAAKPAEIYNLDPRYVTIEKREGTPVPVAYVFGTGKGAKRYPVSIKDGTSQVLHIKTLNINEHGRGMSPLEAAAVHGEMHNQGAIWNMSLLRNGARPSGIVELPSDANEGTLEKLKTYFKKAWQGATNAGTVSMLTGGAKFTALSVNAKDMDFISGMTEAAKNIALVYGVPLPLVTTEAATFSNMDSALERLWSDTVLPLLDEVIGDLSDWLAPGYGEGLQLTYNADSVAALEGKRQRKFDRMIKAVQGNVLTTDEARVELGFDPLGGDAAVLRSSASAAATDKQTFAKALTAAGYTPEEIKAELASVYGE